MALDETTLGRVRELRSGDGPAARAVGAVLDRLADLEARAGQLDRAQALDLLRAEAQGAGLLAQALRLVLADYDDLRLVRPSVFPVPPRMTRP